MAKCAGCGEGAHVRQWGGRRAYHASLLGLVLLVVSLTLAAGAAPAEPYAFTGTGPWDVSRSLEVAPETEPGIRPPLDAFRPVDRSPNFGLVSGAYWFRLRLRNDSELKRQVLEVVNPRLGLVELFLEQEDEPLFLARVGDTEPSTTGVLSRRPPAFEIRVEPQTEQTYNLRVAHHGALHFEVLVWQYRTYLRYHVGKNIVVGFLCGAIAIMFFYHLLLTVQTRQLSYLYFSLFVLCYLLYIVALGGIGNEYIWRGSQWWAVRGIIFWFGLTSLFIQAFTRAFLGTAANAPRWDIVIRIGMAASMIVVLGSLTYSIAVSTLAHALAIVGPVYLLGAAYTCWRSGYRAAGIFLLAWSVLLVCAATFAIVNLGYAPRNLYIQNIIHLGFAASLVIFSLAMDTRARLTAAEISTELERQVAERTRQLQEALENVKSLSGIIPICSHCKKIRNDQGYWDQVEAYLKRHSDVSLTHGVCPDCAKEHYPEFIKK